MTTEIDRTIELSVDGMTCGHCVMSVKEELGEIPGVKNVDVILNSGATSKVTVLTDTPLDDAALSDAVSEAGFTLTGISRDFWGLPRLTDEAGTPSPASFPFARYIPPEGTYVH